jgi:cytochrome c-type biogenesis protein CcmE
MSKGVQIAIATLTVAAALGWMIQSSEGSFQFFASVAELGEPQRSQTDGLRVRGFVVAGSIAREMTSGYVDFAIHDRNPEQPDGVREAALIPSLQVRYDGIDVPDLFRDGAEVVIEGGFVEGRFVAQKIMAKCPSKYEAAPPKPEQKA